MKNIIFQILYSKPEHKGFIYKIDDYFLTTLIILNVVAIILESFSSLAKYSESFFAFEVFSVISFTIEYILRIWVADLLYPEKGKIQARFTYIFSILGIIDLLAVLPFYLPYIFTFDSRIIRILRLFRLFRVFKLSHYNESLLILARVVSSRKNELYVTCFTMFVVLLMSSAIMFELEREAQPDKFNNILESFWWSIATLTTVGYGDIYPVTAGGKIIAAITAFIGIGLIALPTAIISAGFLYELRKTDEVEEFKHDKLS